MLLIKYRWIEWGDYSILARMSTLFQDEILKLGSGRNDSRSSTPFTYDRYYSIMYILSFSYLVLVFQSPMGLQI
jgi:hypothetical protein